MLVKPVPYGAGSVAGISGQNNHYADTVVPESGSAVSIPVSPETS